MVASSAPQAGWWGARRGPRSLAGKAGQGSFPRGSRAALPRRGLGVQGRRGAGLTSWRRQRRSRGPSGLRHRTPSFFLREKGSEEYYSGYSQKTGNWRAHLYLRGSLQ